MSRRAKTPVETLGQLQAAAPHWCWLSCNMCGHRRAAALAQFVIRWGPNTSGEKLRRTARCTNCANVGARTMHVGWVGTIVEWEEFPTDQDDWPSDLFSN
jgi:hypothetical protein